MNPASGRAQRPRRRADEEALELGTCGASRKFDSERRTLHTSQDHIKQVRRDRRAVRNALSALVNPGTSAGQ